MAVNGVRKVGRAKLLREWSVYKIKRDIEKKTKSEDQDWKFEPAFIDRIMRFMEEVAALMTVDVKGTVALLETIDDTQVAALAQSYFPEDPDAMVKVLLNSLLVPHAMLDNRRYTVHFVFRAFHEFFLACHLVRKGITPFVPGTAVAEFVAELRKANFAWVRKSPERIL